MPAEAPEATAEPEAAPAEPAPEEAPATQEETPAAEGEPTEAAEPAGMFGLFMKSDQNFYVHGVVNHLCMLKCTKISYHVSMPVWKLGTNTLSMNECNVDDARLNSYVVLACCHWWWLW